MLVHLHVKNLALIEEAEVDFEEGLNILTGETGAGKSIFDWFCKSCFRSENVKRNDT